MRQEVKRQAEYGRRVRLMFQHEGRFCLLGTPRQCWAPRGSRPIVGARLQRQDLFAFAAVSTHDGVMDSLVLPWANAETMPVFLAEMARRHAVEFIMMVMDQTGWHIAGHLDVPQNMRLEFPPPLYVAPIVKATIIEATSGGRSTLEAPCVTSFVDWPPASLPLRGVSRSRTRKSGRLRITRL